MTSIQANPITTQYTGEIDEHSGRSRGGRSGANKEGAGARRQEELQSKIESGEIDIATFKAKIENRFGAEAAADIFSDDGSINFEKLAELRKEHAAEKPDPSINKNLASEYDALIDLII